MPVAVGNPPGIRTPGTGPNGPAPMDMRVLRGPGSPWQFPQPATATAIRYVRKTGSDSNGGTSPADAWLTVNKALTTASAGTAIYVGAGTYRETVSVTIVPTQAAPVWVIGDVDGSRTGDPGMVQLTGMTTSDTAAGSATTLLNLNQKSNLSFSNILFVGGQGVLLTAAASSVNIAFTDCAFRFWQPNTAMFSTTHGFGQAANWIFDRCLFFPAASNGGHWFLACTLGTGTDYDINIVIQNSRWIFTSQGAGTGISTQTTGSGSARGSGIRIKNTTFSVQGAVLFVNTGAGSTVIPHIVTGCMIEHGGASSALRGEALGNIWESYNLIISNSARTNVTAGPGSVAGAGMASGYPPLFTFGQERIWGQLNRPFGEPLAGSPILGFGTDPVYGTPPLDALYRPRPAGGQSSRAAVGSLERSNTFIADPVPIGSGGSAIKATGPAYAEFYVPVPARPITITCAVRWDATYSGQKPQLQIDANERIGVGARTVTAVGPSGVNETLTLPTFTPSAAGQMVVVRVVSQDQNGAGVLRVDDFTVTG